MGFDDLVRIFYIPVVMFICCCISCIWILDTTTSLPLPLNLILSLVFNPQASIIVGSLMMSRTTRCLNWSCCFATTKVFLLGYYNPAQHNQCQEFPTYSKYSHMHIHLQHLKWIRIQSFSKIQNWPKPRECKP